MISASAEKWASERGISRRSLETFGVASGMMVMPEQGSERVEVLCYPYRRADKIVAVKYRSFPKKGFSQKIGGEQRFWNLDAVLAGDSKTAFIFEGEMDLLAAYEAGLPQNMILSVPNGAPPESVENLESADRYRYVREGIAEGLGAFERFVLAVDADGPGRALRNDLVALLGPARCWFVDWPHNLNDANATLMRCGPGELRDLLEGEAKVWPIDGIYRLSELPEPPLRTIWRPGFPEWENKIGFSPGMLSVFTGYPGHGKSTGAMQLWYNVSREYNVRVASASFETLAKPYHRRNLRQFYFRRPEVGLSERERTEADAWIEERFLWLVHPDRRPSFRWLLDMAEAAVIRHGARVIQIDPWNKLEADKPPNMRETDWIQDCLNEAMAFAQTFNVHFQILAHPRKGLEYRQRNERPALEDIADSRAWENIVDQGMCIFRPKIFEDGKRCTEASIYHLKCRFEELGYECKVDLDYDLTKRCYVSVDYELVRGIA